MKRTLNTVWQRSILWGALFFFVPYAGAQAAYPLFDTIPAADTLSAPLNISPSDTLDHRNSVTPINPSGREALRVAPPAPPQTLKERMPSPQRSTILSAVLPGLGQAYNGKYWKIPIIYGVGAGLYYAYDQNNSLFLKYKILYSESKLNGTNSEFLDSYEQNRDYFAKFRNYCVIGIGILYVANIVDAMTDAYFNQYDISSDLTVKVSPLVVPEPIYASERFSVNYGFSLSFQF